MGRADRGELLHSGMQIENPFHRRWLLILVTSISLLFLWMVRDFLITLFLAAVFSAMAQPLSRICNRMSRGRRTLGASGTLVILILGVGLPLAGFLGLVANQALEISQAARPWILSQIEDPNMLSDKLSQLPFVGDLMPDEEELVTKLSEFAAAAGSFLANSVVGLTRGTATFFLHLFILIYAMFFFVRDGTRILDRILYYSPLPRESEEVLLEKIVSVTRAVIKGSLVIGLIQGSLAGLAFFLVGFPGWAFWMTVMIVLSVIPAIGSALVWVPAAVILFIQGPVWMAVLFTLWCALVVGTVDNFLRPKLIGHDTKMPDLLILVGTLGGIVLFGAVGFIIGPIVASLFLAIWYLYGETFSSELADS